MNSSKDRILDAAERVAVRDGAAHLTLDAVAAESGISKGGLLYHFPSKDDLIRGMIARLVEEHETEVQRLEAEDPCPTGRKLRAMLNAGFPRQPSECHDHHNRVCGALLAAVATNPSLLDHMREHAATQEQRLLEDGLDPITAMIIHLAGDGIWMSSLFGIPHPTSDLRDQVLDRLREMTRGTA